MARLVVVLGDQLDAGSAAFAGFNPATDRVWMCEAPEEARHAWSHQARIAVFLSAMRHFRDALRARGWAVDYLQTGEHPHASLAAALGTRLRQGAERQVLCMEPGEWRLRGALETVVQAAGAEMVWREDEHFLCSTADFRAWMKGRRQPRLEHFYRLMRARTGWLMDGNAPLGGQWNFDADNRASFGRDGPGPLRPPRAFAPDALTREVLACVAQHYGDHPGSLAHFDWPVTRAEALAALADFITHRLPRFGTYQDALWSGLPWPRTLLYHSRLSCALNLKLLSPREVCAAALAAHAAGHAPLAAVEGFVRQILGWREYVRGLYWHFMPDYLDHNALDAQQPLPAFYWTAQTQMNCLHQTLSETLAHGYAHHIQRLMVTGLFALLLGVRPQAVHAWYLGIYVDAVEWVEAPNTLGMSQFADGGLLASKPYIASGKYIQRMSNYCAGCRFDPAQATGPRACPFTTLYWDFLRRHQARFAAHPRLKMQLRNLARQSPAAQQAIADQATRLRQALP